MRIYFSMEEEEKLRDVASRKALVGAVIYVIACLLVGLLVIWYFTPPLISPPGPGIDLQKVLRLKNPNSPHDLPFQDYITPSAPAVTKLANTITGEQEAYQLAVKWVCGFLI